MITIDSWNHGGWLPVDATKTNNARSKPSLAVTVFNPTFIDSVTAVPWKNGAGITRNLVIEPESANLDDFCWRISMAEIRSPSSFSRFPGIDRTILLWNGNVLLLRSPAWPERVLMPLREAFTFAGEDEVVCETADALTVDLNLMVRRGAARGALQVCRSDVELVQPHDDTVVLCFSGRVEILFIDRPRLFLDAGQFLHFIDLNVGTKFIPHGLASTFVCIFVELLI